MIGEEVLGKPSTHALFARHVLGPLGRGCTNVRALDVMATPARRRRQLQP